MQMSSIGSSIGPESTGIEDANSPSMERNRTHEPASSVPEELRQPLIDHIIKFGLLRRRSLYAGMESAIAERGGARLSERTSRTGAEIMQFLCEGYFQANPPSISDVYLSTGLSKSTAIRTVTTLEELGVVEKIPDKHDRRRLLIQFTPRFVELLEEFARDCLEEFRDLMDLGDAAERLKAEEALRESERRYREFAMMSSDWFWESGPDHRFRWFSEGHGSKIGLVGDAFLGKTRWDVAADAGNREKWTDHRADLEARRPFRHFRFTVRNDSGQERIIENSGIPVYDSDGTFQGYRGTGVDITERVTGEANLRESEGRLRRALVSAPIPVTLHADDGEILMLSGEWTRITGQSLNDTPTVESWISHNHDEGEAAVLTEFQSIFKSERSVHRGEFNVRTIDGEARVWEIHSSPLGNLADGRRLAVSMAVDITARKEAEAALILARDMADAALKGRAEFINRLSHELRTPLNSVIGFSQIMLAEQFGSLGHPKYRDYIADINRSSRQVLDLIRDVIDLTRIEREGTLPLEERTVAIGPLIDAAVREVMPASRTTGVRIDVEVAPDLPSVHADDRRLRQVFQDLLENALMATGSGEKVRIAAVRSTDGGIRIEVEDGGRDPVGRNGEDRLLQAYWQDSRTLDSAPGGRGVGLPLARAIAEMHGGSLRMEDRGGSRRAVVLRLPPERCRRAA